MASPAELPRVLSDFMDICFHEDMTDDFPAASFRESARLSVADYFATQPLSDVQQVQAELSRLIATVVSENELEAVLREVSWDFAPWADWLKALLQQINDFLMAHGEQIQQSIADPIPAPVKVEPTQVAPRIPPVPSAKSGSSATSKWIVAICITVLLSGPLFWYLPNRQSSQVNNTLHSDDEQIRTLIANWSAAQSTNNIATEVSFYAPSVDSYFSHRHVSRPVILKLLQATLDEGYRLTLFRTDDVSILMSGNGTAHITLEKIWATQADGNNPHHTRSRLKARRIEGAWLIVSEADLSDRQGEAPSIEAAAPKIEAAPAPTPHPITTFQFNIVSTTAQAAAPGELEFTYIVKGMDLSSQLPYSNFIAYPVADGRELSDIKLYSRTLGKFDSEFRGGILFDVFDTRMMFNTSSNADEVCNYLHALHPDWTAFRLHNPYGPINADFPIPCAFARRPQ